VATPHRLSHHAGALWVVEWHVTRSLVEEIATGRQCGRQTDYPEASSLTVMLGCGPCVARESGW
jgi:hypothetical protein